MTEELEGVPFLVRLPLDGDADEQCALRDLLAELADADPRQRVLSVWDEVERGVRKIALLVSAGDAHTAERLARALVERVGTRTADDQAVSVDRGVGSTTDVGRILLGSDLDEAVEAFDEQDRRISARPERELPAPAREALGERLLDELGARDGHGTQIGVGRILTMFDPRPDGAAPWRSRPGNQVGLPDGTELVILDGVGFDVQRSEAESLVERLGRPLAEVGWTPLVLGREVEEWRGNVGFETTIRVAQDRVVVGLFDLADPVDLIWFFGTCGVRVGLGTDELAFRVRGWRNHARFQLVSVDPYRLVFRFRTLPRDLSAFAAEVVGLCPRASGSLGGGRRQTAGGGRSDSFLQLAEQLALSRRLVLDWS